MAVVAAVTVSVSHVTWRFGKAWFRDDEMIYDEIIIFKIITKEGEEGGQGGQGGKGGGVEELWGVRKAYHMWQR